MTQPRTHAPNLLYLRETRELETSKTDSSAEAVHEECYIAKIESKKPPPKPS